jgi:hypothetical protein
VKETTAVVQSVFDFAMREINTLELRVIRGEDDADAALWEQAAKVVEQLDAPGGPSTRVLAAQWINGRTGKPYSQSHVVWTRKVFEQFTNHNPRPRFRDAYNEVANVGQKLAVHFSSETPEHCTPTLIVERVLQCLGAIDLDPCSNPGTPNVPAARHYTAVDDGLAQPWEGRVYMNPPYGREIDAWVEKLCVEYERDGGVTEAIALVPARTDTQWFKRLTDWYRRVCPVCFIEGRLTFIGSEDPAPFPSMVVYLGDDIEDFCRAFADLGHCWERLTLED